MVKPDKIVITDAEYHDLTRDLYDILNSENSEPDAKTKRFTISDEVKKKVEELDISMSCPEIVQKKVAQQIHLNTSTQEIQNLIKEFPTLEVAPTSEENIIWPKKEDFILRAIFNLLEKNHLRETRQLLNDWKIKVLIEKDTSLLTIIGIDMEAHVFAILEKHVQTSKRIMAFFSEQGFSSVSLVRTRDISFEVVLKE